MGDLRERAPGHALIEKLWFEWDEGRIHLDAADHVVIEDEARGWFTGVLGERRVADLLGRLDPSWTVLHSVPVGAGDSDIDHVVISQAGVFTINTKHHAGKRVWVGGYGCYVDGHPTQYITNSMEEARRAGNLLANATRMTVPVTAVLVFVSPGPMTFKAPPGGRPEDPPVHVVDVQDLLRTLARGTVFDREQTAAIVGAARDAATWHRKPVESLLPGQQMAKEFDALYAALAPAAVVARNYLVGPTTPSSRGRTPNRRPSAGTPRPVVAAAPPRPLPRRRSKKQKNLGRELLALVTSMGMIAVGYWWLTQYVAR